MPDSNGSDDSKPWWVNPGILLIGLVVLSVTIWAIWATILNWNESQENAKQIEAYSNRYVVERCNRTDPTKFSACVDHATQAAQDKQRNEADLYAQRLMAIWAVVVAVCAASSIPLSIAGMYFVFRSLDLNREANATTIMAIRQEQANAHREIRAYMGVTSIGISDADAPHLVFAYDTPLPPLPKRGRVEITVKNFGQTPASKVWVFGYYVTTEPNTRLPRDLKNDPRIEPQAIDAYGNRNIISRYRLNGGQEHTTHIAIGDMAEWNAAADGKCSLYFLGRIYYYDAFNEPWRTTFCFVWQVSQRERIFIPYEQYNEEERCEPPKFD